jgi:hypothetical protein
VCAWVCDRSFGAACRRARGSVAGSLSATTLVLFRRPGRKNDDSGVVQSRWVISRGHQTLLGGCFCCRLIFLLRVGRRMKMGGGQRNAKKSDFFQVKLNRERRLKIRLKKTKDSDPDSSPPGWLTIRLTTRLKRAVEPRTGGLNPGCRGALARRARRLDRSQKAGNITRRVGTSPIGVKGPTRTREHARPGDEREAEFAPEDFLCPNQRFGSGPLIA